MLRTLYMDPVTLIAPNYSNSSYVLPPKSVISFLLFECECVCVYVCKPSEFIQFCTCVHVSRANYLGLDDLCESSFLRSPLLSAIDICSSSSGV